MELNVVYNPQEQLPDNEYHYLNELIEFNHFALYTVSRNPATAFHNIQLLNPQGRLQMVVIKNTDDVEVLDPVVNVIEDGDLWLVDFEFGNFPISPDEDCICICVLLSCL